MSRVCILTKKKPMVGNKVSHANNKTKCRFIPNIHKHRIWVESESRFVKLKLSAKALRTVNSKGIDFVLARLRSQGIKV